MRCLMKVRFPVEAGNKSCSDPEFGAKMQSYLKEIKAESAYFTLVGGQRGGYIFVNVENASQMPALAEPLFHWVKADVELLPVMTPEDLAKAGPTIAAATKKWNHGR